ncbi:MAG: GrpB family protein [Bacteroidota bacterium]
MIQLEKYNAEWAFEFERLKSIFIKKLEGYSIQVEHIGSTSVVGMQAKPILDIDIIIPDTSNLKEIISLLETLGYEYVGDLGIKDREAFKQPFVYVPNDGSSIHWMKHNLYICLAGSIALQNHLYLRNYLRQHPLAADEYSRLKEKLATKYPNDIDSYVKYKTPFITSILAEMGIDEISLRAIKKANGYNE